MALFRMGFVALLPCELPPYRCHVAAATAATIPLCLLRWNCLVGCLPLFAVLTSHTRTPRDALLRTSQPARVEGSVIEVEQQPAHGCCVHLYINEWIS